MTESTTQDMPVADGADMGIPAALDARYFATTPTGPGRRHAFGMDRKATIAALRKLADDMEGDLANPQEVLITSYATQDDFTLFELRMRYALPARARAETP